MPPFLSNIRSRTNSMLDNITGIIPDSPSNNTSKEESLTCRRCGNRFRDRLELSSHFNLLPHHSDYKDSYDFDSFTRPKGRRKKKREHISDFDKPAAPTDVVSPTINSFSESQAFYHDQAPDKENDNEARPYFLRKFPTLSSLSSMNLSAMPTGDQPLSPTATNYADDDVSQSPTSAKAKGKQKATPRLPRDNSFQYGQPLASSDEEDDRPAWASSSRYDFVDSRSRARSATIQGLTSEPVSDALPYRPSSSVASRSSAALRHPSALPPKLPDFDWQSVREKALPAFPRTADDDAASIASDTSFRTAASIDMSDEKAPLKARYADDKNFDASKGGQESSEQRPFLSRDRHASESNLLLESMGASHDDAPPSYHELHGDTDPFDSFAHGSRHSYTSRHMASRSDGLATMPATPIGRFHHHAPQRPRRSTNEWSLSTTTSRYLADSASSGGNDRTLVKSRWRNDEDDLYNPPSEKSQKGQSRPTMSSKFTEASLPPLVASSSFSSTPSPSSPMTPFAYMAEPPLSAPVLALPHPQQSSKSKSSAGRRSRNASRAKSDAAAPSTRCPTCFVKFSSLDKTLEHLDTSDCGAVDFESGIV